MTLLSGDRALARLECAVRKQMIIFYKRGAVTSDRSRPLVSASRASPAVSARSMSVPPFPARMVEPAEPQPGMKPSVSVPKASLASFVRRYVFIHCIHSDTGCTG